MQPTFKHVPPRVEFFSTHTVCDKRLHVTKEAKEMSSVFENWVSDRYLKPKLSCFDGGNISSRSRAHNCDISINFKRTNSYLNTASHISALHLISFNLPSKTFITTNKYDFECSYLMLCQHTFSQTRLWLHAACKEGAGLAVYTKLNTKENSIIIKIWLVTIYFNESNCQP